MPSSTFQCQIIILFEDHTFIPYNLPKVFLFLAIWVSQGGELPEHLHIETDSVVSFQILFYFIFWDRPIEMTHPKKKQKNQKDIERHSI